ncbi:MAG: cytochrome ubiquinol oxidase subunit I [Acidobacteria bacterium]|nr:cytochrome ubiquinol oxidase subunit I [Acidobacteriota bacterium]
MDVLTLSRFQFAVATYFHFLFVPLTLGLSLLVAIMQTIWVRSGDEDYRRMTKFWGKLFLINFAIGVVTGITLEFQFGTNWSRYSTFVGDIFGSLLAIEATAAFFLESTFIAVWFFGWDRLSKRAHLLSVWLVAIASNVSAFWILVANAWMQSPVGFTVRNGRAELTDFVAVITQKFAILEVVHTVGGAYITAGFFVLGISAWHLLRRQHVAFFTKSFRLAAVWALVFSLFEVAQGHMNAEILGTKQPMKLASMESQWETVRGAPMNLVQWPDEKNERNRIEALSVPRALSLLAHYDVNAEVKGLKEVPPADRPPVLPVFLSFRAMVGLAFLFIGLSAWAFLRRREPVRSSPVLLKALVWSIPLPYLANELGWTLAEVGRQPWIVYGLMRTADAVSPISTVQVGVSALGFVLLYTLLGIADIYLLAKVARRGPADEARPEPAPLPAQA